MLDRNRITQVDIEKIAVQWQYDNDIPYRNWKREVKNLFGDPPPTE
jgi:hypothetical protein